MFLPSNASPPQLEGALEAFCSAMNTPVVNIEELDVGPARSAILLCANEYGGLDLMVCIRSITTGDSAVFQFQGDPAEFGTPGQAIEAAMSFAEGIGFIFDEELIERGGAAGRRRAWKIWMSMIGGPQSESPVEEEETPPPAAAEPACSEPIEAADEALPELPLMDRVDESDDEEMDWNFEGEIQLDDPADTPGPGDLDPLAESCAVPAAEMPRDPVETVLAVDAPPGESPREAPQPVLTKFRRSPTEAAAACQSGMQAAALDAAEIDPSAGEAPDPQRQAPSQAARVAQVALASESLGSEVMDATDFLTHVLSSF